MTLPPGNSEFGTPSTDEPLFGEPQTTSDVYATPLDVAPASARPDHLAGDDSSNEDESSSTDADKAKAQDAAAGVKDKAAALKESPTGQKAAAAKEQAGTVVAEAGNQAKNLVGQARTQLSSQAENQQYKLAQGVHGLADTLRQRAETQGGLAGTAAKQGGDRVDSLASYLEEHTPAEVFADVSSFASKRPTAFYAIAGTLGVLGGRVVRALRDQAKPDVPETTDTAGAAGTGAVGSTYSDTGTGDSSYSGTSTGDTNDSGTGYVPPVTGTSSGLGAVGDEDLGSVGSLDTGLESGSYATGSYATSADPLTYEDGEPR